MIKVMDMDPRKVKQNVGTKFAIIAENIHLDSTDLIQYLPNNNLSINELGKQLLKAATEGNVDDIRLLMSRGAPFTADWLGTSPLHLAAQNNHLEACEMLIRAGMSKDARTKVDRTPLHMAAYEGHIDIVECLLKNGADYDCKDMLHMTPLHWAAQNGHNEVAAALIRYGATTNSANKFDLTATDIAMQINRPDIAQTISLNMRDPLVATQHLALELISEDNSTESAIDPIVNINLGETVEEPEVEDTAPNLPIEAIMIDDPNQITTEGTNFEAVQQDEESIQETIEPVEPENNSSYSESIKLLQQHGITMLPVDDSNILNSVMESGHSVVLTEAGKQALNSIKSSESSQELSEYLKPKVVPPTVKKRRIITVTPEEFLAMTSNGSLQTTNSTQSNILRQVNGKVVTNKTQPIKRIVMRKNKIVPISPSVAKMQKIDTTIHDVDSLLEELRKAKALIESYKRKLLKSEVEAARYKQKLKTVLEQNKLASA